MPKFAHMSDIHIGAFRQPELRSLVLAAFESAIDRCIAEKVSFVVMAGDIFDSNIPDLSAVSRAAAKLKEAADAGIRFYAVYGSHDFSPNYSSIVDVLDGAGLFVRAEQMDRRGGKVSLSFVQDPAGPLLCGISGKKLSIDREDYSVLDRESLESKEGLKIFVFHGAVEELRPPELAMMEGIPASLLPSGFGYYAGGHVHRHHVDSLPGHPNIAYPGPLFATDYAELLGIAHGEERGFYLVEFSGTDVLNIEFAPVNVCAVTALHYSAEGKTAREASADLLKLAEKADIEGKVVLLTVEGTLREGRTSEVNANAARKRLMQSGPITVLQNYSRLASVEFDPTARPPRPASGVEREMFEAGIGRFRSDEPRLTGKQGVSMALELLRVMKEGKRENENKGDYEERAAASGLEVLGLGSEGH